MRRLIEEHGGLVVDQHECFTYQIKPKEASKLKPKDFYQGSLYDQEWIEEAIRRHNGIKSQLGGNTVLSIKDDYKFTTFPADDARCKKLHIGRKKRFTISEGMMMFQIISSNKVDNMTSINFWKRVEAKQ